MTEVIFDFIKDILKVPVLRRLLVVLFLPNVLVWGFAEVGIDNQYNPMWVALVGPYWWIEKTIFKFIFCAATVATIFLIVFRVARVVRQSLIWSVSGPEQPEQKFIALELKSNLKKSYEILVQQQQTFDNLPSSEQLEIKKQQAAESLLLKAQWEKETAHIIKAKDQRGKEDEAQHSSVAGNHAPPVSPEDAKRKALRDITGRGA